jgi:tryptophan synthase beta subunit
MEVASDDVVVLNLSGRGDKDMMNYHRGQEGASDA